MKSRKINESNHKKVMLRNLTLGCLKMTEVLKLVPLCNQTCKDYSDSSEETEDKFEN